MLIEMSGMRRSNNFGRLLRVCTVMWALAFPGVQSPEIVVAANMKVEFNQYLEEIPEVGWDQMSMPVYVGMTENALTYRVLQGRSMVVYTVRSNKGGRRKFLYFHNLITMEKLLVPLLDDVHSEKLDIQEIRVTPNSKTLWLCIGIHNTPGWHQWFSYDVDNNTLDRRNQTYERLCEHSKEDLRPMRVQVLGPVWSASDASFYENRIQAEEAGAKRLRYNWNPLPTRRSKITCEETIFELITGGYSKGHVFVKGEYVTSLTMGHPSVSQGCWFVQNELQMCLYKFVRGGKGGALKSRLQGRSIENVIELPDVGILVTSTSDDYKRIHLDFVPLRLSDELMESLASQDKGN